MVERNSHLAMIPTSHLMYNQMQADNIADVVRDHGPPVPDKVERDRFLFTVKVVIAEGLVPLDSSPSAKLDTFVTLSDPDGNRKGKTRTIYETLSPRCRAVYFVGNCFH